MASRSILSPFSKSAAWIRKKAASRLGLSTSSAEDASPADTARLNHDTSSTPAAQATALDEPWLEYIQQGGFEASNSKLLFDDYIYTLLGFMSDPRAHVHLDHFPASLPFHLAAHLGSVSTELATTLRQDGTVDDASHLIKHAVALTRASHIFSRLDENHDDLATADITSHMTAIAVIILSFMANNTEKEEAQTSFVDMLRAYTMPYVHNIFKLGQPWIQTPSLGAIIGDPSLSEELKLLDAKLESCFQKMQQDVDVEEWVTEILCILNAWMRCSGERAQLMIMHQPMRTKILRLVRYRSHVEWASEVLVVMLACLPSSAENPDTEEHLAARALISGVLAQMSSPLAEDGSDEDIRQHDQTTIHLTRALRRGLRSPRPSTLHRLLLDNDAVPCCLDVLSSITRKERQTKLRRGLTTSLLRSLACIIHQQGGETWFQTKYGYARLWSALVSGSTLSKFAARLWLELVVGSDLEHLETPALQRSPMHIHVILAPAALRLLFQNLAKMESGDTPMLWILHVSMRFVSNSYHNASRCCDDGIVEVLVDLLEKWRGCSQDITDMLIALLQVLISHSTDTKSLRRILNMMFVHSSTFRSDIYFPLHRCLRDAVANSDPIYFLDLHGVRSMLWIQQIEGNLNSGYTFHTWIRIETLSLAAAGVKRANQSLMSSTEIEEDVSSPLSPSPSPSPRSKLVLNDSIESTDTDADLDTSRTANTPPHSPYYASRQLPQHGSSYEPRLFSFHSPTGAGIEAFFSAGRLAVRSSHGTGKAHVSHMCVFSTHIPKHLWTSLALVHVPVSRQLLGNKGEVRLFLDGRLKETNSLPFYARRETFLDCRIGRGRDADESQAINPLRAGSTSLRAQIASVHLFEPLNAEQLAAISSLGPNYCGTFDVCTLSSFKQNHTLDEMVASSSEDHHDAEAESETLFEAAPPDALSINNVSVPSTPREKRFGKRAKSNASSAASTLIAQSLQDKMIFSYSAQLCKNGQVRDQAAVMRNLDIEPLPAVLSGTLCVRHSVREVISTLGGVQVLCFLLAQLDDVVEEIAAYHQHKQVASDIDELGARSVSLFFELVQDMLRDDVNITHALKSRFLGMVAALIKRSEYARLGKETLDCIQALLERASPQAEFVRVVCKQLLFDFDLWRRSEFYVRIGHIQIVSGLIKTHPTFFRQQYGVQFVIDLLRPAMTMATGNASSFQEDNRALAVSGSTSSEECDDLHTTILRLIEAYLEQDVTPSEALTILRFLVSCEDQDSIAILLTFLHDKLLDGLHGSKVGKNCHTLLTTDGPPIFMFSLLQRQSNALRSLVLKTLVFLARHSVNLTDSERNQLRLSDHTALGLASMWSSAEKEPPSLELLQTILNLAIEPVQNIVATEDEETEFVLVDSEYRAGQSVSFMRCQMKELHLVALIFQLLTQAHGQHDGESLSVLENVVHAMTRPPAADHTQTELEVFFVPLVQFLHTYAFDGGDALKLNAASPSHVVETLVSCGELPAHLASTLLVLALGLFRQFYVNDNAFLLVAVVLQGLQPSAASLLAPEYCLSLDIHVVDFGAHLLAMLLALVQHDVLRTMNGQHQIAECFATNTVQLALLCEAHLFFFQKLEKQNITKHGRNTLKRQIYDFAFKLNLDCISTFGLLEVEKPFFIKRSDLRHGGMRRIMFRLIFEDINTSDDDHYRAAAIERLQYIMSDTSTSTLKDIHVCFLLWQLDNSIKDKDFAHDTVAKILASILKYVLRQWPISTLVDPVQAMGVATVVQDALHSDAAPEAFEAVVKSDVWRRLIEDYISPQAFAVMDTEYVDQGAQIQSVSELDEETRQAWSEMQDKFRDKENESLEHVQDQILEKCNEYCASDWHRLKHEASLLQSRQKSAVRRWVGLSRFLLGYRGILDDGRPRSERIVRHWKLDSAENFSRMRLRLAPFYSFDQHTRAAELRDNAIEKGAPVPELDNHFERRESVSRLTHGRGKQNVSVRELERVHVNTTESNELLVVPCRLVCLMDTMRGVLTVTKRHVIFHAELEDLESFPPAVGEDMPGDFQWHVAQLREIHMRRFNLRQTALELFLVDQTNFFLDFEEGVRDRVHAVLVSLSPPRLTFGARVVSAAQLLAESGLTARWRKRQISNYDYLMMLNTIAGRSFNDLNQYPVMPWVLSDYQSSTLDLTNPATFRDFRKPIGALNDRRAEQVKVMYDDFEDPTGLVKKFHYGTHYSNAAGVIHYLVRLEPFTSLHVGLQSGKFDHADRQFLGFQTTWQSILDGTGDVKELIPELFCLPECLRNREDFDFGCLQSGARVNHVGLPPWATSVYDFTRKHRQALESDHVSEQLHHWIDLIFGYKQRGPAAEEALNVFYYTSYEGEVDFDACESEAERRAQQGMIREFGQTPSQLLFAPHPQRLSRYDALMESRNAAELRLISQSIFEQLDAIRAHSAGNGGQEAPILIAPPRGQALKSWLSRGIMQRLVTITAGGSIAAHGWTVSETGSLPFQLDVDTTAQSKQISEMRAWLEPGTTLHAGNLKLTRDGGLVLMAGSWDHCIKVVSTQSKQVVFSARGHQALVTCLALDSNDSTCVSGSADGTCMVWKLQRTKTTLGTMVAMLTGPHHVLYGHEGPILDVAIQEEVDLIVTASGDGTCNMFSVRRGTYIRTIDFSVPTSLSELAPEEDKDDIADWKVSIQQLQLSRYGTVIVHAQWLPPFKRHDHVQRKKRINALYTYSCNGDLVSETEDMGVAVSMCVSGDGDYLVTAERPSKIIVRNVHTLEQLQSVDVRSPISAIALTDRDTHIMAGLKDGHLLFISPS